ncbi:MAG: single-stranded-DNA-specific exonuclease RecJ [Bernardetiaceae bacterium]|nr:single-stranded-DNA-specific exonuclease RecJ [Bernardetiaceae bacterium]
MRNFEVLLSCPLIQSRMTASEFSFVRHIFMEKRWIISLPPPQSELQAIGLALQTKPIVSALLWQRHIRDAEAARCFFKPAWEDLHNPFLMKGMLEAVQRLQKAIKMGEKVLIYGDYDVDGTTSVALMYLFLQKYLPNLLYYIPDRHKDGYGITQAGLDFAVAEGVSLIISLDCGTKSVEQVAYAASRDIDFIICDHHLPEAECFPVDAIALLNPKQSDCNYPFKELSGCAVGFKFLQGFCQKEGIRREELERYLDLVAVSIAADMVSMCGENRTLLCLGLAKMNSEPLLGLRALAQVSGIEKDSYSVRDIIFGIAPRINAASRMADAGDAVELLLAEHSEQDADEYARRLNFRNDSRKHIEREILQEAYQMLDSIETPYSTLLYNPKWNKGLLGIIANRSMERRYRPTIVLSATDMGQAVGSARSIYDFDLYAAIEACADLLDQFGGHKYAVGLAMPVENIEAFRQKFESIAADCISEDMWRAPLRIDLDITLSEITEDILQVVEQMEPFGTDNQRPLFCVKQVEIQDARVLKERHLKFRAAKDDTFIDCIGFGLGGYIEKIRAGHFFDICFYISKNTYYNPPRLQLEVKDLREAE